MMSADAAVMCGTDEFGEYICITGDFDECCKRSKQKKEMLAKEFEAELERIINAVEVAKHVRKKKNPDGGRGGNSAKTC